MTPRTLAAGIALMMALMALPQVAASSDAAEDQPFVMCLIRDFVCWCTATTEYSCADITGTEECGASVGPSRGIQVGLLCPINIGS